MNNKDAEFLSRIKKTFKPEINEKIYFSQNGGWQVSFSVLYCMKGDGVPPFPTAPSGADDAWYDSWFSGGMSGRL